MEPGLAESQSPSNTTRTISLTSPEELLDLLESTTGDCVQVNQVSIDDFGAIENCRNSICRELRLFYEGQTRILVVTLPTRTHEALYRRLDCASTLFLLDMLIDGGSACSHSAPGGPSSAVIKGLRWIAQVPPPYNLGCHC